MSYRRSLQLSIFRTFLKNFNLPPFSSTRLCSSSLDAELLDYLKKSTSVIQDKRRSVRAAMVHLLDEDGLPLGKMKLKQAWLRAEDKNLKMIDIDTSVDPPVYRLITAETLALLSKLQKEKFAKEGKPVTTDMRETEIRLRAGMDHSAIALKAKQFERNIKKGSIVSVRVDKSRSRANSQVALDSAFLLFEQMIDKELYTIKSKIMSEKKIRVKYLPSHEVLDGVAQKKGTVSRSTSKLNDYSYES